MKAYGQHGFIGFTFCIQFNFGPFPYRIQILHTSVNTHTNRYIYRK